METLALGASVTTEGQSQTFATKLMVIANAIITMADAEEGFSADAVQKYLLAHGGRATNVQVVGHFAKYLNDPEFKGEILNILPYSG